jgi:signal transduction histidine kinase
MKKAAIRNWFSENLLLASISFALAYFIFDFCLNFFVSHEMDQGIVHFYFSLGGKEDVLRFLVVLACFIAFGSFVKNIILERKQIEKDRKRHLNEIKSFAYSVSHDLKSPAIGLFGLTKHLHKNYQNQLDERGRKWCDTIKNVAQHILALVEDINIFLKTRESPMRFEKVNAGEILELIREEFSFRLESNRIEWHEPNNIPLFNADRNSVHRIFRNLVDNALKYGGNDLNQIIIECEDNHEFLRFFFHDNGKGIREEDQEIIFKPFSRSSSSKEIEGSGLGLAIVKEIVEKHGGQIWIQSVPEKGTTFCFSISKHL